MAMQPLEGLSDSLSRSVLLSDELGSLPRFIFEGHVYGDVLSVQAAQVQGGTVGVYVGIAVLRTEFLYFVAYPLGFAGVGVELALALIDNVEGAFEAATYLVRYQCFIYLYLYSHNVFF